VRAAEFPVFCISTVTAITTIVQRATRGNSWLVLRARASSDASKTEQMGLAPATLGKKLPAFLVLPPLKNGFFRVS
jgi:hypothetical protein